MYPKKTYGTLFTNESIYIKSESCNLVCWYSNLLGIAETLLRIAKYGYKEFYYGETSDLIINCMNRVNGIISIEDLHSYEVIEKEPIHGTYRGYNIYSMPPSSSGGITLVNILNQIENINIDSLGFHSCPADPDCWMRSRVKPNGNQHWEYTLLYSDDYIVVVFDVKSTCKGQSSITN